MVTNVFQMSYLILTRPFYEKAINDIEIFNEFIFSVATFVMILFSDTIDNAYFKYNIGWVLVGLLLLQITVNFMVLIYVIIKGLKLYL